MIAKVAHDWATERHQAEQGQFYDEGYAELPAIEDVPFSDMETSSDDGQPLRAEPASPSATINYFGNDEPAIDAAKRIASDWGIERFSKQSREEISADAQAALREESAASVEHLLDGAQPSNKSIFNTVIDRYQDLLANPARNFNYSSRSSSSPTRRMLPIAIEWRIDVDNAIHAALGNDPKLLALFQLVYVKAKLSEQGCIRVGWAQKINDIRRRCAAEFRRRGLDQTFRYHHQTLKQIAEQD